MSLFLIAGIALTGFLAAGLGTMVGLGGGVFVVPILAVVLGVELKAAIAASAVCVVLNSLRGSSVYLQRGLVNVKLAMVLQVSTAVAAIVGGLIVIFAPVQILKLLFAATLALTIGVMIARPNGGKRVKSGPDPYGLRASFDRPDDRGPAEYVPQHVRSGIGLSSVAGLTSGMLGIGGGAVQVPIMNTVMAVPLRAAVATSTFMVGITATVSALIYAGAGLVDVAVTVPAMAGIVVGAQMGGQLGSHVPVKMLRTLLIAVLLGLTIAMAADGLGFL